MDQRNPGSTLASSVFKYFRRRQPDIAAAKPDHSAWNVAAAQGGFTPPSLAIQETSRGYNAFRAIRQSDIGI